MNLSAFIPARSGSKRIPGKNIRSLCGHPLLAYAIQVALDAGIFDAGVYVSSDADAVGDIARHYGAEFLKRPEAFARDTSPDAEWIAHALSVVWAPKFAILRPTSPFRIADTILRAVDEWDMRSHLKAVERVGQHPGKMWALKGLHQMEPLWFGDGHLCQTNTLRELYVQNASLELRTAAPMSTYQPFFTQGYEGLDLNLPEDWILAEALVERGLATLPKIERSPYAAPLCDAGRE